MTTSTFPALAQVQPIPTSLSIATDIAIIVIAIALLVLVLFWTVLAARAHRLLKEIRSTAMQNFGPVSDRARSISDNVEYISQAVRSDVDQLSTSVNALTERLHLASDRMEERIEEFNALMEVVQGEAEEIFIDTASTVRGVRESARSISGTSDRRGRTARSRRDRLDGSDPDLIEHPAVRRDEPADDDVIAAGEA